VVFSVLLTGAETALATTMRVELALRAGSTAAWPTRLLSRDCMTIMWVLNV